MIDIILTSFAFIGILLVWLVLLAIPGTFIVGICVIAACYELEDESENYSTFELFKYGLQLIVRLGR